MPGEGWLDAAAGIGRNVRLNESEVGSVEAARAFAAEFSEKYGDGGPQWEETGWHDAMRRASTRHRLIFIYLHSRQHEAS